MPDGVQSPEAGQNISRRDFLKLAGAGLVTFLLKGARVDPEKIGIPKSNNEGKGEAINTESIYFEERGVMVWGDSKGKPLRWRDANGRGGKFNQETMKRIIDGEQQVSGTIVATLDQNENETVEAGDKIDRLPEDIVSTETLRERGVEVVQIGRFRLHIRESAFNPGNALENYMNNQERLLILVTDRPSISIKGSFVEPEFQQYGAIIEALLTIYEPRETRRKMMENYENSPITSWKKDLLMSLWESMSDEEIVDQGLSPGVQDGYHMFKDRISEFGLLDNTSVILLALGGRPEKNYKYIKITRGQGRGGYLISLDQIKSTELGINPKTGLSLDQNDLDPSTLQLTDEFKRQGPGKLYGKYRDTPPGFLVRHEMAHNWKLFHRTGDSRFDHSESETDILAAQWLTDARQLLERQRDDSGYYFVLEDKQSVYLINT